MKDNYTAKIHTHESNVSEPRKISAIDEDELEIIDMACRLAKEKNKNVETTSAKLEEEKKVVTSSLVRHDAFHCRRKKPQHFYTESKWRALGEKKTVGLKPKQLQYSYEPTMSGLSKATKLTSHPTTNDGGLPLTKHQNLLNKTGKGKNITFKEIVSKGCLDLIISYLNLEEALRLTSICRIWYVLGQKETTNGKNDFSSRNSAEHYYVSRPPLVVSDSALTKGEINDPESGQDEAILAVNANNGKEINSFQRIVKYQAPEPIYSTNKLQPSRQESKQNSKDKSYLKFSSFNDNTDIDTEMRYSQQPLCYIYQNQDPTHKRRRLQHTQQITQKSFSRKPMQYYETKPESIYIPKQLELAKQKMIYEGNNIHRLFNNYSYNDMLKSCKQRMTNDPTYDKHSYIDYSHVTNSMITEKFDVKGEFQRRFGISMHSAPGTLYAPYRQLPRQEIVQTRQNSFIKSGFSSDNTEIGYFKPKNLQPTQQKVMYERYNIDRSCINFNSLDDKSKQIQPVKQNMKCKGNLFDIKYYHNMQRKEKKEKIYVDHSYIDYSRVDDSTVTECSKIKGDKLENIIEVKGAKKKGDGSIDNDDVSVECDETTTKHCKNLYFPQRLMIMLHDNPNPKVVSWLPHGRSFLIQEPKRFFHEVLPLYFNKVLLKTFKRMLNLWGFKRISTGRDWGAYYHQFFLRGMPNLVCKMVLTKKKNGKRPHANP